MTMSVYQINEKLTEWRNPKRLTQKGFIWHYRLYKKQGQSGNSSKLMMADGGLQYFSTSVISGLTSAEPKTLTTLT